MVENYNKPMPQGYTPKGWDDTLKEGVALPENRSEPVQVSVSMEKLLDDIKVQLKQNPKMSIKKIITRVIDFNFGGIPGKYFPHKGYVGDVRMRLLTVLREKGEKAFVNIIEHGKYDDYFDEQVKLESTKKLAEEDTNKYHRDDKRVNWASRQGHEKDSNTENVVVENKYGDLILKPKKIQERHKNKNLTHGDGSAKDRRRDQNQAEARQHKEDQRFFWNQ
ncbi:MAG TPA: hypothetical protein PL066_01665 [bacterium]|nr:hypothetical protein [bacterium]